MTNPYLKMIADHYGKNHQLLKMAEECGELQTAIARYILNPTEENYRNLVEEIADVQIMCAQNVYLLDADDEATSIRAMKLDRQLKRMENER